MQGICPGATTIVTPKLVGSRTTNGQMKATSKGEFDGFPGLRDGPNHADRLDRASRVVSACIPRKKPQTKESPSVRATYPDQLRRGSGRACQVPIARRGPMGCARGLNLAPPRRVQRAARTSAPKLDWEWVPDHGIKWQGCCPVVS